MPTRVRKAVFPVAGLGTRLLPATKSIPKEMITIVDRPLIQYAVDEAREAGIEQLIFVTGRGKSALVDYFDQAFELEATLQGQGQEPRRARAVQRQVRRGRHRPPAAAARARPRGLVRAPHRRRRAVRGAAPRRADDGQAQLPRADGRSLRAGRRQHRRRARSARQRDAQIWRDRSRRDATAASPKSAAWSKSPRPAPRRRT